MTVHQLARQTGAAGTGRGQGEQAYTVWARCGRTWPRARIHDRLPADVTAAASAVTCPDCLDPPSWAEAGIPL